MNISIIVIVKNDPGIEETLHHLASYSGFAALVEVIVVDSTPNDGLKNIRDKFPSVKWLQYRGSTEKKSTIPEQRNLGIKNAKGDIVVFIDANCVPCEGWLNLLCAPILKGQESIVSGTVRTLNPKSLNNLSDESRLYGEYLPECATINLALKKEVFEKIGFFDESFLYGSDVDFTWRAIDGGFRIKLVPSAFVSHDWGNFYDEIKRSIKYGSARVRLYLKHPHRLKNLFGFDIRTFVYPVFLLGLPLVFFWPTYLLLLFVPLYRSRKNKPVKFTFLSLVYGFGVLKGLVTTRR